MVRAYLPSAGRLVIRCFCWCIRLAALVTEGLYPLGLAIVPFTSILLTRLYHILAAAISEFILAGALVMSQRLHVNPGN